MDLLVLHSIDEELTKSEVAALKFLCLDVISRKHLENVKDAKDLFLRLKEKALLDDAQFLAELLHTIARYDLLVSLGTNKNEVSRWLQTRADSGLQLSSYRKMLYKLSEDITAENLEMIKFLLDRLPKAKLQEAATFLDVLSEMEKIQLLTEDNLDELVKVLDRCDRQLANQVKEFRTRHQDHSVRPMLSSHPDQEESMEVSGISLPIPETSPAVYDRPSVFADAEEAPITEKTPREVDDCYPLKRRPRGYCLIINNHDFKKSRVRSPNYHLQDRKGTEKDANDLAKVFTRLHFTPDERTDLCASEIQDVIKEFAEKIDHSQMDAFVCCILSHGLKGTVLGTDGESVQIRVITQAFARCKSLLNKPKVFFIQACQGKQLQKSVYIQADGEENDKDLYEDAQSIEFQSIPVEADFLIGMATVESYVSYRHISKGSIFIQELCKQLNRGMQTKEDILSILTRVNREVSLQVLNGNKQMPEPRYTLTKKLFFTLD